MVIVTTDELDLIEVGDRATRAMQAWDFSEMFAIAGDRIYNAITIFTCQVAVATSRRGHEFPPEWELPDDWQFPRDGLVQDERGGWRQP